MRVSSQNFLQSNQQNIANEITLTWYQREKESKEYHPEI